MRITVNPRQVLLNTLCLWAVICYAQKTSDYRFDRLGIGEGLSSSYVYDIIQDQKGFTWFATEEGLDRFDGYSIINYRYNERDTIGLKVKRPKSMALLKDSTLVIGGTGGISYYNIYSKKFFPFKVSEIGELDLTTARIDRVLAVKSSGISDPSNVVGPVHVDHQAVIDNFSNYGKMFHYHNVEPVTGQDRSFKEDKTRVLGDYGAEVVYYSPGNLKTFNLFVYENNDHWHFLKFQGSSDGENWKQVPAKISVHASSENNYGYGIPKIYRPSKDVSGYKYLKVKFYNKLQLSRIELIHE